MNGRDFHRTCSQGVFTGLNGVPCLYSETVVYLVQTDKQKRKMDEQSPKDMLPAEFGVETGSMLWLSLSFSVARGFEWSARSARPPVTSAVYIYAR